MNIFEFLAEFPDLIISVNKKTVDVGGWSFLMVPLMNKLRERGARIKRYSPHPAFSLVAEAKFEGYTFRFRPYN